MVDAREDRIKRKAYELWEEYGKPEGRSAEFWDMATELIAIEDGQMATTVPLKESKEALEGEEDGEPLVSVENTGEFPTLTDQGEQQIPHRDAPRKP
ncbi:MAG TPA: DUF2934 domain-containing protein [Xanthobacteraceae bacterium]|nr:DUF2934 domain-containing protein [Xanthobacteraceae bacterium]HVZ20407.1 DUF2934 domain-containing protein [Vicinamibacterales bacterium]